MAGVRLFTLEEAERTLPLVRRIVEDLLAEYPQWLAAVGRFEVASSASPVEPAAITQAQEEVAGHAARIDGYLRELDAVGCVFKGFDAGLVDFYSLRDDQPVYLCWHLGESRITHWHGLDAGFAGRQPIDRAILSETHP